MKYEVNHCSKESEHFHHVIPVCIGGTDNDGRIYLCKKHHDILQNMLIKFVWEYIDDKSGAKFSIKEGTKWFLNKFWKEEK